MGVRLALDSRERNHVNAGVKPREDLKGRVR